MLWERYYQLKLTSRILQYIRFTFKLIFITMTILHITLKVACSILGSGMLVLIRQLFLWFSLQKCSVRNILFWFISLVLVWYAAQITKYWSDTISMYSTSAYIWAHIIFCDSLRDWEYRRLNCLNLVPSPSCFFMSIGASLYGLLLTIRWSVCLFAAFLK